MLAISVIGNAMMQQAFAANTLTVNGTALDGKSLSMWVNIAQNGSTVKSGFTPLTFAGTTGATYSVIANDYSAGNVFFDHWASGSTSKTTTITLNADTTLTALYKTPVVYNLTVKSADLSGKAITGYYTTIMSGSTTVATGFTPLAFSGNQGSYTVSVYDYGSFVFDHWSDGSATRSKVVALNSNIELVAHYKDTRPPNSNPVASNDSAVTMEGTSIVVGVLGNDSDADNDALTVASVADAPYGSAVINGNGTVTYTPDPAFVGIDTFEYTISDGKGGSSVAKITVQVDAKPLPVHELTISSADLDGNAIGGHQGTIEADGMVVYSGSVPYSHIGVEGSYIVIIQDSGNMVFDHWENGATDRSRTVVLNADMALVAMFKDNTPVNNNPVAVNDSATVNQDSSVAINVISNDSDVDGDSLAVASVSDAANGSSLVNANGTILYTPDPGFTGTDTFDYTVSDGKEGSDTGTVTVTVNVVLPPTYNLSIQSVNLSGGAVSGFQTIVTKDGTQVLAGPTPQSYTGIAGSYVLSVQDSATMVFDHWENGSTTRSRTVNLTADTTISAYFRSVPTNYILTVKSSDLQNNAITGLYTTIYSGSTVVKTGFTPLSFTATSGASYTASVSDYGSSIFDHWDNGSTTKSRAITMSADSTITALFKKPAITISPASGTPGTLVTVTGSNFSPGSAVAVTYGGTAVVTTPTSVVASSAGAFTASFRVPTTSAGPHTVKATDAKGWNAQASFQDTSISTSPELQALLPKTGVYVALYMYPGSTGSVHWQKVIDEKTKHPSVPIVATFNPSSGPGTAKDNNIANWVAKLKAAGVIAIGYTYDDYGTRSLAALKADADKYKNWYNADGLFIDEFTNKVGYENHYKEVTAYVKSIGMKMTMGNPGTDVPVSYLGTVTVINTSEGKGYIPLTDPNLIGSSWVNGGYSGWHKDHDKRNFTVMRYDASSLDTSFVNGASQYTGLILVTSGNDSDGRWFALPSYFGTLVATLDK